MSDIQTVDWQETAANNNVTPPAGWPEGQAPSTVNDCAREMMGALKRDWDRNHATVTSGGTSSAFTLTYTVAPPAYVNGLSFRFKAHIAPAAGATMAPGGLAAKAIQVQTSAGLVALSGGEWQVGHHPELEYDSGADVLVLIGISSGALTGNFAPSQQTTPNMTVLLAKGTIENYGTLALTSIAAQSTGTITAPVANPRNDIVYIDQTTGVIGVVTGTPAASPADPAMVAGKLPIARIRLQATTTSITNSIIDDIRQLPQPTIIASGVVGSVRNGRMSTTAATATATFLADEVVVETALGGSAYRLASYSQVINLATTGAGGMDTGTAPVSGFVSIYAIYNPTTSTASILACAQATSNGSIYSGGNMPAGYTASALIASWPTNGSSQFPIAGQIDRKVYTLRTNVLSITAAVPTSYTNVSLSTAVPTNARSWSGIMGAPTSVSYLMSVAADVNGMGAQQGGAPSTTLSQDSFFNGSIISDLIITVPQQTYYKSGGGSTTARIDVTAYTF